MALIEKVENELFWLHPCCAEKFHSLNNYLADAYAKKVCTTDFRPFETYRSPRRQEQLYQSQSGATKARKFQSAHQFGLAVDFVPYVKGKPTWEAPEASWKFLAGAAAKFGLERPWEWDKVHIQHPIATTIMRLLNGVTRS